MSYSRWSNSKWYTFWTCKGPESDIRDEQMFEICDFDGGSLFTYKMLHDNIEECLDMAIDKADLSAKDKTTKLERDELKLYMRRFMEDVEEEFKE